MHSYVKLETLDGPCYRPPTTIYVEQRLVDPVWQGRLLRAERDCNVLANLHSFVINILKTLKAERSNQFNCCRARSGPVLRSRRLPI